MSMVLTEDRINPTDRAIVQELRGGRCTPSFIAERAGYSSGNIRNRLVRLAEHGHVNVYSGGLYELVDDPLQEEGAENTEDPLETENAELRAQLDTAHEKIEDLEAQQDQAEGTAKCYDAVREAHSTLERARDELESERCNQAELQRYIKTALETLREVDV